MAEQRVVLVDGVGGYWGGRVAERRLAEPDLHVLGLDTDPPRHGSGLDFVQADMRNPLLVELLKAEHVETYVHLAFLESDRPNETAFEYNVMGAMKVLSACAEAGVKQVILKSSTQVYGALPSNSAFLARRSSAECQAQLSMSPSVRRGGAAHTLGGPASMHR